MLIQRKVKFVAVMMHGREEFFPLSLNQRNIWNLEQSFPGTSINNISTTMRIKGRVDFALLQKSVEAVIASDISLRTQITLESGQPFQYHAPFSEEMFPVFDFSLSSENGVSHWENVISREPLPLYDTPLYRFYLFREGEQEGGVLIKIHHIISDGWSQVQLCNKIGNTYLGLLSGIEPELEPAPSYRLHVEDEHSYLSSAAFEKDLRFWTKALEDLGDPATLKKPKSASVSPVGQRKTFALSEVLNHAIHGFCLKHRVAPFSVFYMALAIYLKRMGGSDCFNIGVPIFNRTNLTFRQTTGMFVSTLPFFNIIDDNWNLSQFNDHLADRWYELLRHQKFPFSNIMELAQAQQPGLDRLFHLSLSYQDTKILKSSEASVLFSGQWHYGGYQSEQLCIHLSNLEDHKRYSVSYDYLTQLFSEREIDEFHEYLSNILLEALTFPERPIYGIALLKKEEQEKVLYSFNQTARPLAQNNLYEEFSKTVMTNPKKVAVIQSGKRLTYEALDRAAMEYASALASLCPNGKQLIAILLPRSVDLFKAMVGIMRSGNAWVLLSPDLPEKRILEILRQSGASAVISKNAYLSAYSTFPENLPVLDAETLSRTADSQELPPLQTVIADPVNCGPEDTAYVVYTSGSTGVPKGVEICQRSLLNLAKAMAPVYGQRAVLSVCNIGFDAFLLESAAALLNGRTIVLGEEGDEEDPQRLAHLISCHGVSFLATTPSRLSAYLNYPIFASALRNLDSIVCGGEPFTGEFLQRLKTYTSARIYNQYGPSETAVAVSYQLLNDCSVITIGRPMDNCRMYVLDSHLQPLPIGAYGNLYIGGVCVGKGYRNAPELTAEVFMDNPFEPGERLYDSGDIACWTPQGELILSGRKDQQVKLRGLRIEPQEVAACLTSHPAIRASHARILEQRGQNILVAYYTADAALPSVSLRSYLADYIPSYMLPSHIQHVPFLPLTPNGKVDESQLPDPPVDTASSGSLDSQQEALLSIFRQVLHNPSMSADADYFLSGGNSLNAMETIAAIEERFQKRLRVSDLYACRTALGLDEHLSLLSPQAEISAPPSPSDGPIPKAPELESYPLTPSQESIYVQTLLDSSGLSYNMPGALCFSKEPDQERLRLAFEKLIAREETLRTAFVTEKGVLRQKILDPMPFQLPVLEASSLKEAGRLFVAPFDLAAPPLLRAALWQDPNHMWNLLVDTHHIVGDGLTTPLLLQRLGALYQEEFLADAPLRYRDYACWLHQRSEESKLPHQKYWESCLLPLPEPLEIPVDTPRLGEPDFCGSHISITLNSDLSEKCDAYCREQDLSPYMLFTAAFGLLLSKLTGSGDFIIGTPVSGRTRPELWEMCGLFINTLPLRLRPEKDLPLKRYIEQVKNMVMELMDHQDLFLEEIISHLNLPRIPGQNPLYQIMFSMRPLDAGSFSLDGAPMEYIPISTGTSKLNLSVEAAKEGSCYSFHFEYATDSFEPETVALYGRSLEALICSILSGEDKTLSEISALSPVDRLNLIERPRVLHTPYLDLPVDQLLDQMATICPDAPAIIFHGETITYRELERRATDLAGLLSEAGAVPGDHIALMGKRNPDLIASMWGIMKAGCAYVPMLASFPEQRMHYMLETANVTFLLCDEETKGELPDNLPCPILLTREDCPKFTPPAPRSSNDTIHVLFTSGSTGQPKGVTIRHRSIANLISSMREFMDPVEGNVLFTTNIIFDTAIAETLIPLALGKCVILADQEEMMLPWELADLIHSGDAKMIQMTPSRLQMCLTNEAFATAIGKVGLILLAGEVLSNQLLIQIKSLSSAKVLNAYGPAEASVYVTAGYVEENNRVTLGKPLNNCRVYLLDQEQKQVIPTAAGEIWLAGECLSSGYISRPDLTAEAFLPDPFFPGGLMYRSGDLGRLRWDGSYSFLGRRDSQVKLNGQRIELEEVSGAIQSSGLVSEAAVIIVTLEDGSKRLRAYIVAKNPDQIVSLQDLRIHLSTLLPDYMIPSEIVQLGEMPHTASHKIDRRALESLAESYECADLKYIPESLPEEKPQEDLPSLLVSIWKSTLHRDEVRSDLSFFEQGGTSLAALCTLSEYYNHQLVMTLAQFYANPTIAAQVSLFTDQGVPLKPSPEAKVSEPIPTSDSLAEKSHDAAFPSHVPPSPMPARRKSGVTLITGATGFLGAHLVKALLDREETQICCLTRDGKQQRLLEVLGAYFGNDWVNGHWHLLEVICGDLRKPHFGLENAEYSSLVKRTGRVLHAAADVRHYAQEADISATNVQGTAHVADFALDAGAYLSHISTLSVSGDILLQDPATPALFSENDFFIGQNWQDNIYVKTKFLAEMEVYKRIEKGLYARIFRVGRLVGRAQDGMFQRNPDSNLFYNMVRGIFLLGAIPSSMAKASMDLTAVDVCADAILTLGRSEHTAYHIAAPDPVSLLDLAKALYPDVQVLDPAEFKALISRKIAENGSASMAVQIGIWNQAEQTPANIHPTSERTHNDLISRRFAWPKTDITRLLAQFILSPEKGGHSL